ncbi:MAG: helix-turn-helix transcriptional regulator [Elusimicrobiota bacterium]
MGNLYRRPVRTEQALNEAVVFVKSVPKRAAHTSPAEFMFAVRARLGLSQVELAERLDMAQQQVQRLESGKANAKLGTWRRVFNAMHCDLLLLPKPRRHLGEVRARRVLDGQE